MSGFQRFVTYINSYEENSKIRNVGFAKIEKRGTQCNVEIHMKGTGYSGISCPVYLFVRKEKELLGISIGNIQMQNGSGDYRVKLEGDDINQSSYGLEQVSGMMIFVTEKIMFASQWDEKEILREQFRIIKSGDESEQKQSESVIQTKDNSEKPSPIINKEKAAPITNEEKKPSTNNIGTSVNNVARSPKSNHVGNNPTANHVKKAPSTNNVKRSLPTNNVGKTPHANNTGKNLPTNDEVKDPPVNSEKKTPSITNEAKTLPTKNTVKIQPTTNGPKTSPKNNRGKNPTINNRMKTPPITNGIKAPQTNGKEEVPPVKELEMIPLNKKAEPPQTNNMANLNPKGGEIKEKEIEEPVGNDIRAMEAALQTKVIPMEQSWLQKWQFIKENYPVLTPFEGEEGIICIRMELKDLRLLPKRYWYLGNNSFLLHGFFNYRYLVLGNFEKDGISRWFIGVPGVFQSQEKVMASIFGFPEYKSEKKSKQKTGQFGYWYRFMDE